MLILRDMRESDIEDYVRWFTKETEWGNWDAPWEAFETSEEEERKSWTVWIFHLWKIERMVVEQKPFRCIWII